MKRMFVLLLSLMMLCSTGAMAQESVTLTAMVGAGDMNGDYNQMQVFKDIAAQSGTNVVFEQIGSAAFEEIKSLTMADGNLPDLFYGEFFTTEEIAKYADEGYFLPLEDLIREHAPNLQKLLDDHPTLAALLTMDDGHIYTIPFYDEFLPENIPDTLFINQIWLDKLGLQAPETTDELYEVLKAFKEKDPNGNGKADEIPLSYLPNNGNLGDFSLWGSWGVLDNSEHLQVRDGKVIFSLTQDGYKEGVKYFAKLYAEGLLDPEVFTHDRNLYASKGKQDDATYGVFVAYTPENFVGTDRARTEYSDLLPLAGPDGDRLWNRYDRGYYTMRGVITDTNPDPVATIKWFDAQFEEEMSVRLHWGEIGKNIEKTETGWIVLDSAPEGMTSDEYRFLNCPAYDGAGALLASTYEKLTLATDKQMKTARYELYDPFATREFMPTVRLDQEGQERISVLYTDIDTYVKQMKAKWITGESDVEADWAAYCAQLEAMGVDEYVSIYQAAYDAVQR